MSRPEGRGVRPASSPTNVLLVPLGNGCTANFSFWREHDKTFYVELRVR